MDALTPPMGSGFLPDGNLNNSCYFKNLAFVMILVWTKRLKKYMGDNYKPATRNGLVLDFMLRRVDNISNLENLYGRKFIF
jgi:hypothetical protein